MSDDTTPAPAPAPSPAPSPLFTFPPGFELPAPPPYEPPPPVDRGPWYYAQLDSAGVCIGVMQTAGPIEQPSLVRIDELDATLVGQTRDAEASTWLLATPPAPPAVPRRVTRLAFLQRFADAEAVAIDLVSQGATVQAAGMRRYMSLVNAAAYIDLDRPDTRAGVMALEAGGALGEGRAAEILDGPISDTERYLGA